MAMNAKECLTNLYVLPQHSPEETETPRNSQSG